MNIGEALSVIHEAQVALQPAALALRQFGSTPQEIEDRFADWDRSTQEVVEEAAACLAESEDLPKMTSAEASMLYLRLMQAYDYVDGLIRWERRERPVPDDLALPDEDRAALLYWLLTDYWEQIGYGAIRGVLEEIASGNARSERIPDVN